MAETFDAIIIGTGQAGPPLAKRLADAGMRVAIAERHLFGGTCVNTGCIPTKTMVASAYAAHMVRRAADFGVVAGEAVRVDMARVKARKDAISERSRLGVERTLRSLTNCSVYQGAARFQSPREVQVGSTVLRSERIFINVGARASIPPMPGLGGVPYLTNSSILNLDVVPAHLLIVGGSYVGLEFGQMFRRFGSQVTIVEKSPQLVSREDQDISNAIREILTDEGIDVRLNAQCIESAKAIHQRAFQSRRNTECERLASAAGNRATAQYRRPRPRRRRHSTRRTRLHRGRRQAAHQCSRHLGARRL
jgi:pyruvate/2-oxoglutarate dehydrogenase complex dihydrolipoamide dehydrogenase (E3) component